MCPHIPGRNRGFTLIELMVAVVVAGVLAAAAYPAFTSMVARGRRADAIAALTTVMQTQERFRSNRTRYASSFDDEGLNLDLAAAHKYYEVTMSGLGEPAYSTGYILTARPRANSPQNYDKHCQVLKLKLEGSRYTYSSEDLAGADTTAQNCWRH
ncbi:type IV pilin protein [Roseateles sp. LKC17W]|uniref:Type IV pilin protein n=2 Tax=Pelomonas margarita TaxID=3299031 RepID=A0ABW7FIL9_9BURK